LGGVRRDWVGLGGIGLGKEELGGFRKAWSGLGGIGLGKE